MTTGLPGSARPASTEGLLLLQDAGGGLCLARSAMLPPQVAAALRGRGGGLLGRFRGDDGAMERLRRFHAVVAGGEADRACFPDDIVIAGLEAAIGRGVLVALPCGTGGGPGRLDGAQIVRELSALVASAPPSPLPADAPVPAWPLERRFEVVLQRTQDKLPDEMREEFAALIAPQAIAVTIGILVLWAASHAFGIGEIVDVILLVVGFVALGWAVFEAAAALFDFVDATFGARTEADLDRAATHLANAIALLGVAAFAALLRRVGARMRRGVSNRDSSGRGSSSDRGSTSDRRNRRDEQSDTGEPVRRPRRATGDFSNLGGRSASEVLEAVPENATSRKLVPVPGKVQEGIEYKWVQDGQTWRVRMHGPDPSAPAGAHAREGWIVRVQRGGRFMDGSGEFHPRGISNPDSPFFDPTLANDTHIPIQAPSGPTDYSR